MWYAFCNPEPAVLDDPMDSGRYFARARAERAIGTGRVVLSAFWIVLVQLHPGLFARYWEPSLVVLGGYLGLAAVVALLAWLGWPPLPRARLVTHGLDLAVFGYLLGPVDHAATSPLFVGVVFCLLSGTLRWHAAGALGTAAVIATASTTVDLYPVVSSPWRWQALGDVALETIGVAVAALLFAYFGLHQTRLERELARLSRGPEDLPSDPRTMVRGVLQEAAGLFSAPRLLLSWQTRDDASLHLGLWSADEFTWTQELPEKFHPLAADQVGDTFLCDDVTAGAPGVLWAGPEGIQRWRGMPLHPALASRFHIRAVAASRLEGDAVDGWAFWLDRPASSPHDLELVRIAARQAAVRLDYFNVLQRRQAAGAADERRRLARDLHDGLLQSLTAVGLKLETIQSELTTAPATALQRLAEVKRLVTAEQQHLRLLIQDLRPTVTRDSNAGLLARLSALADRLELEWGMRVEFRVRNLLRPLRHRTHDVYYLVSEALGNAARHARASHVIVELSARDGGIAITVTDNGSGFPFHGHFDHQALQRKGVGPGTLKERVAGLGGSLAISSSERGARLEISLPLAAKGS